MQNNDKSPKSSYFRGLKQRAIQMRRTIKKRSAFSMKLMCHAYIIVLFSLKNTKCHPRTIKMMVMPWIYQAWESRIGHHSLQNNQKSLIQVSFIEAKNGEELARCRLTKYTFSIWKSENNAGYIQYVWTFEHFLMLLVRCYFLTNASSVWIFLQLYHHTSALYISLRWQQIST